MNGKTNVLNYRYRWKHNMNNVIKILLPLLLTINSYAKDLPSNYFIHSTSNTNYIVGKTYETFEDQIDFNVSSNSYLDIAFLNNVFISINENTKFSINQAYSDYTTQQLPTTLKPKRTNYTLSVMDGDVNIINANTNNTDNILVIHTPRINMILNEGEFKVIADGDTTIVAVHKGSAYILNVLEGRKYKLLENNCGIITKHIPLSTKDANFYSVNKSTISPRPIPQDDMDKLKITFNKLSLALKNIIFVAIENKIHGVNTD